MRVKKNEKKLNYLFNVKCAIDGLILQLEFIFLHSIFINHVLR